MVNDTLSDATLIRFPVASAHDAGASGGFPGCRDLLNYWQVLRGSRLVPARSEFDPRGIEQTLASTFVAEKVAPSVARIRVAGSQLNALLGMDVRGMPISAFFDPASRDTLGEALRSLFSAPQYLSIDLRTKVGFARRTQAARMILLPLCDAQGVLNRMVGCLETQTPGVLTPRRFQITALHSHRIYGTAPSPAPTPSDYELSKHAPGYAFAEGPAPFKSSRRRDSAKASPSARPSHLKLVVTNE